MLHNSVQVSAATPDKYVVLCVYIAALTPAGGDDVDWCRSASYDESDAADVVGESLSVESDIVAQLRQSFPRLCQNPQKIMTRQLELITDLGVRAKIEQLLSRQKEVY